MRPLLVLTSLCVALYGHSVSSQVQQTPRGTFEDVVSVFEVVVPLQVLLRGKPVAGLGIDNFEVYDGKVRRDIVAFDVVDLRAPTSVADDLVGQPADSEASLEKKVLGSNRHLLVLFDVGQSPSGRLARAVESVRSMLAGQLHPSDRVGVALLGGRGTRLLVAFTEDRDRVGLGLDLIQAILDRKPEAQWVALAALRENRAASLRELSYSVGPAAAIALGNPETVRRAGLVDGGVDLAMLSYTSGGRFDAELGGLAAMANSLAAGPLLSRVRRSGQSLGSLVTLLQGVPDPKYLLLFSGGLQGFVSLQSEQSNLTEAPALIGHGITRVYAGLVRSLRQSGWVVQSFDVAGVGQGDSDSLFFLSRETGGKLYDNYGHLDVATDRLLVRTSVTYRLWIRVEDLPRDGAYHPLKVELRDGPPRAKVVARHGYYAPKSKVEMTLLERRLAEADELFTAPDDDSIDGSVLLVPSSSEDGKSKVHVAVFADLRPLVARVGYDRELRLEVQGFAAEEHAGRPALVDIFSQSLRLDVDAYDGLLARGGLTIVADLDLGSGPHQLRFRIREPRSGLQYLQTERIEAGPQPEPFLAKPLIIAQRGESVVVREAGSSTLEEGGPFRVDGGTHLPSQRRTFARDEGVVLLLRAHGMWSDRSALEAQILPEAAGPTLPAALHQKDAVTEGRRTSVLAWLDTSELSPGGYALRVVWREGELWIAEQRVELTVE